MNSLSRFSRWNRFQLLKPNPNTPEPTPTKSSFHLSSKCVKSIETNTQGLTPQYRKGRDVLNLTIKHQNRSNSHQESSSLSTKCNLPYNRFKHQKNYRNKQDKENSLSLERFGSGGKWIEKRHKINYSILQRIRKALDLYPHISHENKLKGPKQITFATQSQDQGMQSSQNDVINLQKLVLWRQSKLIKTIQKIYEFLMEIQLKQSQNSPKKSKRVSKILIAVELKKYLMHRYKTEKLCKQNFINLLYSLYYYLDKVEYEQSLYAASSHLKMKARMLSIFQKFLIMKYNEDDLIFYLYSKNIFQDLLGETSQNDEVKFVTRQQLGKFLNVLANGDTCIIKYFENYLGRVGSKEPSGFQVHEILALLLANFQNKKSSPIRRKEIKHLKNEEIKRKVEETKTQGLSCSRISMMLDHSFWKTEPPSQQSIPESLYQKLLCEMGTQIKKLVSLFHSDSNPARDATAELILIKGIRMLNTVHKMDKYRWFEQMQLVQDKVLIGKGKDFQEIETLQKDLRGIQQADKEGKLQRRRIVEFTKRLLTVKAFVDRLEELFEVMENHSLESQ